MIIIAGALSLLWYVFVRIPNEQRRRFERKMREIEGIYSIMANVLRNTNAERFLILKSENGRGIPTFGAQLHVSVVYEDYSFPFSSVKAKYQKLPTDREYLKLLKTVYDSGDTAFFTSEMEPGILKDLYINEGVAWSYIFAIGHRGTAFYYASIATSKQESTFQEKGGVNASVIRLAVQQLRSKYKKMNNTVLQWVREKLYL